MDGRGNERRTIRVEIVLVTALWSGAVARPSSTRHEPAADGNRRQSLGHAYTVTCFRLVTEATAKAGSSSSSEESSKTKGNHHS